MAALKVGRPSDYDWLELLQTCHWRRRSGKLGDV